MTKKSKSGFIKERGVPLPLGVTIFHNWVNFAVSVPNEDKCRLNLYDRDKGTLVESIFLTEENRTGDVFSVRIKNNNLQELAYMYQIKDKEFIDPYAEIIYGRESYGKIISPEAKSNIRGGFNVSGFDWQGEKPLNIPYSDLIIYKLHVRGFTRHPSSGIEAKGTFHGIAEKIPYFHDLGINCVQLMPIYEYNEIIGQKGMGGSDKINYWGYSSENAYFVPKAAYGADPGNVVQELKSMVYSLHRNGIEVIMEMNFTKGTKPGLIQDCLRHWILNYHIDGFRISSDPVPAAFLAADPILGRTKLLAESWDMEQIYPRDYLPGFKNLAQYNTAYSVVVKRFLRGDEEQVASFACRLKRNPDKCGVINYITNHDGFTLMDLYSYDVKHNERNRENNHDGEDYNYSWNCGAEGSTRIKKVLNLRKKQIRNAFVTLFFSQGTPLLLAGDEFGNSQAGNNNAYCQDNEISWLDWSLSDINKDIFNYVKQMIRLRKEHPILHMGNELRSMDYISCGFPDLSFHGTKAWYPDYNHYSRILGVMLSGNYVKINRKENDNSFYLAFNMHWEKHGFDLPNPPEGKQWHVLLNTEAETNGTELQPLRNQRLYEAAARSVAVLISK